jgi:hypothetical protein
VDSNTADSHLPKSKQGRGGVASAPPSRQREPHTSFRGEIQRTTVYIVLVVNALFLRVKLCKSEYFAYFYTLKWKQLNICEGAIFRTNNLKMCKEFHEELHGRIIVKRWNNFFQVVEPIPWLYKTLSVPHPLGYAGRIVTQVGLISPHPLHILKIWTEQFCTIR